MRSAGTAAKDRWLGHQQWRMSDLLLKVRQNAGCDLGGWYWLPEEKPLHLIGVSLVEKGHLFCGLDAFHGNPHVQLAPQSDDSSNHRLAITTGTLERLHKTLVDLDFIECEAP